LLHRIYKYPLEYVIEALAPTTERDYTKLPADKQRVYQMLQTTHMHASPDGPWFFLIAQSERDQQDNPIYRLTGITDTSMLRPQVFAWQEHEASDGSKVSIGFAASEKQAIDAALEDLAREDNRFWTQADRYWNARGGSHTDGGAFLFSVKRNGTGKPTLKLTDKFGQPVSVPTSTPAYSPNGKALSAHKLNIPDLSAKPLFDWAVEKMPTWDYAGVIAFLQTLQRNAVQNEGRQKVIDVLTLLMDRRYPSGKLRRSSLLSLYHKCFAQVIEGIRKNPSDRYSFISSEVSLEAPFPEPLSELQTAVVDARGFASEGAQSLALAIQGLYSRGFRRYLLAHVTGQRFIANGLGVDTAGVHIDLYGSPGDYLGSGLDGAELHVHTNGQDQLAQIMKAGKLVVHGDVGQTFMYGAKGGEAYILGNAAGRPLINAVGGPRVVINGTCLDYLAESFMAGDPHNGGGFVILNGIRFDEAGDIVDLETPYPGGNLYSMASGGAIYVRDPFSMLSDEQLNGGEFTDFSAKDWDLIHPYLQENARHFGIPVERLLTVDVESREPNAVYRKIQPSEVRALMAEEAWVSKQD
ncbi:MAG: glutamate synthase, partial [Chloroflexi bacterium]|nr:glutamate synthase [Chloroflexota bacterium]